MKILTSTATFTRPADTTAYAAGDLIANSVTAGSVVPMVFNIGYGQGFKLLRASVAFNSATVTLAKFKLYIYGSSPTVTNGDNGAWLSTASNFQGSIDIDSTVNTFSDNTIGVGTYVNTSVGVPLLMVADQNYRLYGLLTATAAYVPTSAEIFTVSLIGEAYV